MKRCDSMAVLINHDHAETECISSDSESEGTCSGYGSETDLLDEYESDDKQQPDILTQADYKQRNRKEDSMEKMCFKSTNALSKHLKYVMSLPELCDVKFLVGKDKMPVYGVKAIMATRSRTFYHLIVKHQRKQEQGLGHKRHRKGIYHQHLAIDVQKYDLGVFQKLIQFVHCGSVDVSIDNAIGLLCGATQFGLNDLAEACWDFFDRCLHQDSIYRLLSSARNYSQHKITKMLLNKINVYITEKEKQK